jgi:Flp pilus assembly protein TadG
MLRPTCRRPRRGAVSVENALVLPVAMFLLVMMCVGGLGVFRYQQVAALAREASRYASVHGGQYAEETGKPVATGSSIRNQVLLPNAIGLDPSRLNSTLTWNTDSYPTRLVGDNGEARTNTVSITVSYQWIPEALFGGMTLSSRSEAPIAY